MKRRIYFVLSTHWDREWYQTFQNYRYQLVHLLDDILEGIEQKKLNGPFYTDGQVCLLEDYLVIRPEKLPTIQKYLKDSNLVSGPWYVLPDEFLVSGESLIRNLRLGVQTVSNFGAEPSKAGFLCDMFGHISQMPQILGGFGVETAILWRGVKTTTRNVVWEGADGTRLPTYVFLYNNGYGAYAMEVRNAIKDHFKKFDTELFGKNLAAFLKQEADATKIAPLLLFDGLDHQFWDKQAYQQLQEYIRNSTDFEMVHGSLDDYMAAMLSESGKITEHIGHELREVADANDDGGGHLISGVLSSRVDIKQANTDCQNLLCAWAEPFSVLSWVSTNHEYPKGFLDTAWKWLILNHPHDSICGCSIDQVHEDMKFRFSQCSQIADRLTDEALKNIGLSIDQKMNADDLRIVVFNPLPSDINDVQQIAIQIPTDWPFFQEFFGYEKLPSFRIYDADGNELEYQRLAQQIGKKNKVILETRLTHTFESIHVNVAVKLKIPALGYTTLVVRKAQQGQPVRHSSNEMIHHSGNTLENKFLKVSASPNGSLSILDKRSGQQYENLLTFEDTADIGDGWFHGIAVNDETFYSTALQANISIIDRGPETATMKIETVMNLPEEFCFSEMVRSPIRKNLLITSFITLTKDSESVKIETVIENNIKDHRLRAVFPSGANVDSYFSDSVFDVVERKIALDQRNYLKKELETDTKPQQSWTAISDTIRGLAVVSTGLYETAVADEPSKPIKLTLFRSTRKTIHTSGEPNGQLQKQLSFKYLVLPFSGMVDRLRMFKEAQKLGYGIRSVQIRQTGLDLFDIKDRLLPTDGLLNLKGAVLTSVSIFKGKIEIRFFNPSDKECTISLKLSKLFSSRFTTGCKVDNDGNQNDQPVSFVAGAASITALPKEIVTMVLQ